MINALYFRELIFGKNLFMPSRLHFCYCNITGFYFVNCATFVPTKFSLLHDREWKSVVNCSVFLQQIRTSQEAKSFASRLSFSCQFSTNNRVPTLLSAVLAVTKINTRTFTFTAKNEERIFLCNVSFTVIRPTTSLPPSNARCRSRQRNLSLSLLLEKTRRHVTTRYI